MTEVQIEQGPIRPPSESRSLFIRLTRNCPWNQCLFCPVYKGASFSRRTVSEVKKEIDALKEAVDDIRELSQSLNYGGQVNKLILRMIFDSPSASQARIMAAAWLYHGTGTVFLQDADNFVLKPDVLVEILIHLKECLPDITRITTYARAKSVKRKSLQELKEIRKAGLDRLHLGLETGHDPLLKLMKKGATAEDHISAGKKAVEAGFEVSEYVMPGLGGNEMSIPHAKDTAAVLNEISPHFIRLRTLRIPQRIPLYKLMESGDFTPLSDEGTAKEIKLFLTRLKGINSTVVSDHIMNLMETVKGRLPEDRDKMIAQLDAYLLLSDDEKLLYRVGRFSALFRGPDDLKNEILRNRAKKILSEIKAAHSGKEEKIISQAVTRFI